MVTINSNTNTTSKGKPCISWDRRVKIHREDKQFLNCPLVCSAAHTLRTGSTWHVRVTWPEQDCSPLFHAAHTWPICAPPTCETWPVTEASSFPLLLFSNSKYPVEVLHVKILLLGINLTFVTIQNFDPGFLKGTPMPLHLHLKWIWFNLRSNVSLTNSFEKKRSEKQRRKGKI